MSNQTINEWLKTLFQEFQGELTFIGMEFPLTKRTVGRWGFAAFSSIFLPSGFFCSQAKSQPTHLPLTQTISLPAANHGG